LPSKEEHLKQANKNERFYVTFELDDTEFLDWAVTVLFYSILHYVDAFLADRMGYDPPDHYRRTSCCEKIPELRQIYNQYMRLKDQSEKARYWLRQFTPASVRQLEQDRFQPAKTHLETLF